MVLDTESMGKARVWGHVVSLVRLFLAAYCCGLRQCGRLGRAFCRMDRRDYATIPYYAVHTGPPRPWLLV